MIDCLIAERATLDKLIGESIDPADGPSQTFAARSATYLAGGTPPGWDGVHVMQGK